MSHEPHGAFNFQFRKELGLVDQSALGVLVWVGYPAADLKGLGFGGRVRGGPMLDVQTMIYTTTTGIGWSLIGVAIAGLGVTIVALRQRGRRNKPKTVAFFHPYCNAGGGGRRLSFSPSLLYSPDLLFQQVSVFYGLQSRQCYEKIATPRPSIFTPATSSLRKIPFFRMSW